LLIVPIVALTWNEQRAKAQSTGFTFVVNMLGDAGDGVCDSTCTLRDALQATVPLGGTVRFDPIFTAAKPIILTNTLGVGGNVNIEGYGAPDVVIQGAPGARVFNVNTGFNPGDVIISGVTITGGSSVASQGGGGAIFVGGGSLTLERVHISNNGHFFGGFDNGQGRGGGIVFNGGTDHRILNSTISGNQGISCGGISYNSEGTLAIVNSTISNNNTNEFIGTGSGGGLCIFAGDLSLRNVTITGNMAFEGGGIEQVGGTLDIANSIVAGNGAAGLNPPEIEQFGGTFTSAGHNLVGNSPGDAANTNLTLAYHVTDILDAPSLLGPLQNNGGTTPTIGLLAGSPAIDAGDNAKAIDPLGDPLFTDQRGFLRYIGWPVATIDIGAFEFGSASSWSSPNPAGTNVTVTAGPVTVDFSGVTQAGDMTVTPIDPAAPGPLPPNFTLGFNLPAYEISTTALYTAPLTVCMQTPAVSDPIIFFGLRILHYEGGQWFDRTIVAGDTPAPDFATRTLCARVNSLSPFVVAYTWMPNPTPTPTPTGDTTAPNVSILSPLNGATFIKGQAVSASYSCRDEPGGSGLASCTGTVANGALIDTSTVGSHAFTVTATDLAGNSATATSTYNVVYFFSGFLDPVENLPALNIANAGSAIPVKFSLGENQGLAIFAGGYPASSPIRCDASEPGTVIEDSVTGGSSWLSYNTTTNQYNYVWKTEKSWKGTCRMLVVRFNDGTEHLAKFRFK
jgi:CSLREA domain-containing protein